MSSFSHSIKLFPKVNCLWLGNIPVTFFFKLSSNIFSLQVETLCCTYYRVCDQLVSQQNTTDQIVCVNSGKFRRLATLYFVARQVGHKRVTTCNNVFQLAMQQSGETS